ncbi:helix-turn-helix domain-containing protein [Nostoc sp. CCY 9925]|uniref:helix-turn-helix domain-containing protein n=1 Tax=Nostoc sp. CCY 9925 TaxID=3103865 RepID=UPI0039C6C8FD
MNTTCERKNFLPVVPSHFDEYGLEPMEYRLYSHIVRRAGKEGCFESIPNMARSCLMNEKTVRKSLRVLVAARLVTIVQERRGRTSIYQLTQPSQWVDSHCLPAIRQELTTNSLNQNSAHNGDTSSNNGSGTKSGRGVVPDLVGVVVPNLVGVVVPDLVDEVYPNKVFPSKELTLNTAPSTRECVCEETDLEQLNQDKEPIPQSPTSLSTKSGSSFQTDNPSCRPTMAAGLFEFSEQSNNKPSKPKFQSIEDLLNLVLLDPSIMASDPLPAVYRSEIKLRGWRFPWRTLTRDKIYQTCDRRLVELIAKERAKWSKCEWQEKIPTVIKSIGNLEATKGGLEELLGYWSKVVESVASPTETSQATTDPIGYYSNRSLEWHKATFCELLDLGDKVGTDRAIAQFSTRYDQQNEGATDKWLDWLKLTQPTMYAYLHPQAA